MNIYITLLSTCCRDTLFYEDFDLQAMVDDFYVRKSKDPTSCLLTSYTCSDKGKYYINAMLQKPSPGTIPCFHIKKCLYKLYYFE